MVSETIVGFETTDGDAACLRCASDADLLVGLRVQVVRSAPVVLRVDPNDTPVIVRSSHYDGPCCVCGSALRIERHGGNGDDVVVSDVRPALLHA